MRQLAHPARWLARLGESPRRASASAIAAPPPGPGEVLRTALPDTFDGIRYEIGRMMAYVQAAKDDPVIVANTELVCSQFAEGLEWSARMNGVSLEGVDPADVCVEAIDRWCREHFVYVNDPPNVEVIQTPRRMVQMTRVPPGTILRIMEPCVEAVRGALGDGVLEGYEPAGLCWGDCDEAATLLNGKCAACRLASIQPVRFRFGGHDGTIHHVWSRVGSRAVDSDLTEPGYGLGDHSRFPHYEEVEVSFDLPDVGRLGTSLGVAASVPEDAGGEIPDDLRGFVRRIADGRKDPVLVDAARLVGVHYGRMVERVSVGEGRPVSSHNNKTLFLEGLDIWSRTLLSPSPRASSGRTEDPKEVVAHVMRPWYEALALEDPSTHRPGRAEPPPAYVGSPDDATCIALALSACLDVGPVRLAFGVRDGRPERMWGRVKADGKWYDTDVNEPFAVLGDRPEYPKCQEFEVPL